jgi:hypothetical protein
MDDGADNRGSVSGGLGVREIVGPDLILGANGFIDMVKTDNNNTMLGMTLGVEAFTSIFDLRLNAHLPLGGASGVGSTITSTGVAVVNHALVEQSARTDTSEALLYGITGELGATLGQRSRRHGFFAPPLTLSFRSKVTANLGKWAAERRDCAGCQDWKSPVQ